MDVSFLLEGCPMISRSHRIPGRLLVLAVPALLGGCVIADGDGRRDRGFGGFGFGSRYDVEYRCDDDRRFRAIFNDNRERVTVETRDRTYRLRLDDRDGRRRQYGEGDVRLTVDRDEAYLRIKDENDYQDCRAR